MWVTDSGMVRLAKELQFSKAQSPMWHRVWDDQAILEGMIPNVGHRVDQVRQRAAILEGTIPNVGH